MNYRINVLTLRQLETLACRYKVNVNKCNGNMMRRKEWWPLASPDSPVFHCGDGGSISSSWLFVLLPMSITRHFPFIFLYIELAFSLSVVHKLYHKLPVFTLRLWMETHFLWAQIAKHLNGNAATETRHKATNPGAETDKLSWWCVSSFHTAKVKVGEKKNCMK